MSKNINKYGLSRTIPENVKRQIRRDCGFGCVCCGLAIASYEHIEPEFHKAKNHDPNKMAYLCEGCHARITRKFWSKEKVKEAREKPFCIQRGKCHDAFDVSSHTLIVWLGSNKMVNIETILKVDEINILTIEPPEELGAPYRLSGKFYDENESFLFEIIRNEWFGEYNNWDIECEGGRIIIRSDPRQIVLQILCKSQNELVIEKMNMFFRNTKFVSDEYEFCITVYDKSSVQVWGREFIADAKGCVAFSAVSRGRHPNISQGGQFTVGHHGALKFIAGGQNKYVIRSMPPPPDLPDTFKGNLLKKNWGTIRFNVPSKDDKLGKNDSCYCQSGLKYKKCCGAKK